MTTTVRPLFAGQRVAEPNGNPTTDLLEVIQRLTDRVDELETAVLSSDVTNIVLLASEAEYTALTPKDPTTLYIWPP